MMKSSTKPIPDGFNTLTPHLVVKGAAKAIEFYKKAFGAEEMKRMPGPDGKSLIHADLKIGNSRLLLVDEFPEMDCRSPQSIGGSPVTIHMFVKDVDATFERALAAGGEVRMPLADQFWGDRYGVLKDPFGHIWSIATHKEDLTPQQIGERARAAFSESVA
jgi:PhnB protein